MKKIFICLFALLFFSGCSNKEKLFKEYCTSYYNDHMSMVKNIDFATVTLDDLHNASSEDDYDLSKFKKCDKQSKVVFTLDKNSGNITSSEIDLNC